MQVFGSLFIDNRDSLALRTDSGHRGGNEFAEALHTNDGPMQPYANCMLYAEYKLMEAIFKAPPSIPLEQILGDVARTELLSPQGARLTVLADEQRLGIDYTGFMRGVQGEVVPEDAMPRRKIERLYTKFPSYSTQISDEVDREMHKRRIIGQAENNHLPDAEGYRIMIHQEKRWREIEGPEGDISIVLNRLANFVPFVPGYEIVSVHRVNDDLRFGLRYTGEDPYVPCRVRMPEEGLQRVISVLSDFKLHDLADILSIFRQDLTVADFVTIMQSGFDVLENKHQLEFRRSGELSKILRQCVRKGEISVVCQQAAAIIQESICMAFGTRCAQTVIGHSFPMQGGPINDVSHEQVAARLEGRLYILDASPGLPPASAQTDATAPLVQKKDVQQAESIPEASALATKLRKKEREDMANQAERILYEQLRGFFDVGTNEAVHERLYRARRRDVAAHTIGCLLDLRAQDGRPPSIGHTIALLDAAVETRSPNDPFGAARYPRSMLESMRYALRVART